MKERIIILLCLTVLGGLAPTPTTAADSDTAIERARDRSERRRARRRRRPAPKPSESSATPAPNAPPVPTEPPICTDCLTFWAVQGPARNNHMCKDKSRANGTKGWDCFNCAEDTSHGYECIAYCPPATPTCESRCDQKKPDGSPWHDHPERRTRNKNTDRVLGPPGSAPVPHQGLESRDKCVW